MTTISGQTLEQYLQAVSAKKSTPGGGAVAAVVAAEGCALIAMVVNFTKDQSAMPDTLQRTEVSIQSLSALADADGQAFSAVMAAYRSGENLPDALRQAAGVPAQVISICRSHLDDLEILETHGNPNLITDVGIAAALLQSAVTAGEMNVLINCRELENADDLKAAIADIPQISQQLQDIQDRILRSLA
jgi:formiminotetrahydrofolate cyclodeaminase